MFDILADCDHALAPGVRRPAIEFAHYSALHQTHVCTVGPCCGFMVRIVNRADHRRVGKAARDATDNVRGPQMTVNQIRAVLAQPTAKFANRFRNIARTTAVETNNRHAEGANRFQPMRRVRIDRDHRALHSFRIKVFQVGVQESLRAAGTESLDEMNDLHIALAFEVIARARNAAQIRDRREFCFSMSLWLTTETQRH